MADKQIKDILIKAAEDVQQGMWCVGKWFSHRGFSDCDLFPGAFPHYNPSPAIRKLSIDHRLELAQGSERCAEGSIALATALLGGTHNDYLEAIRAVEQEKDPGDPKMMIEDYGGLADYNDTRLVEVVRDGETVSITEGSRFAAGQILAGIFRSAADKL